MSSGSSSIRLDELAVGLPAAGPLAYANRERESTSGSSSRRRAKQCSKEMPPFEWKVVSVSLSFKFSARKHKHKHKREQS